MSLPASVERLISMLAKLPGVGRRGAERMAFHLITSAPQLSDELADALVATRSAISTCPTCGYFTEEDACLLCDRGRDASRLLVVESPLDVVAFEKSGEFKGLYHVLGGHLSPLKGITPADLRIEQLEQRLEDAPPSELILATSPTVEGDATALYLSRILARDGMAISRLGRGVPMGGSLQHTDSGTLRLAFESRRTVDQS